MKTFTVVSPDNGRIDFETEAITYGDFKRELSSRNISLTNKSVFEGLTKVELSNADDNYVLPTGVMHKGVRTDNLVFMITAAKKNINSGINMTRQEIISRIKSNNLCEKVREMYGKNYTNVSSELLLKVLETSSKKEANNAPIGKENKSTTKTVNNSKDIICDIASAIVSIAIKYNCHKELIDTVINTVPNASKEVTYSKKDLDDMFSNFM